jgi:phospholipid/cholesterol/gamma-HCH transport system ATP-binding protein
MTDKSHACEMISLNDIYKSFGPKVVLNGLNLDIKKGESLVIIGGSGTGKSVMRKLTTK